MGFVVFVDFCSARVEGLLQVCSMRVEGFFIFNASSFFSCSAFSGFVPICSMYVAVLCVFFERGKQPVCQVSKVYIYFFLSLFLNILTLRTLRFVSQRRYPD